MRMTLSLDRRPARVSVLNMIPNSPFVVMYVDDATILFGGTGEENLATVREFAGRLAEAANELEAKINELRPAMEGTTPAGEAVSPVVYEPDTLEPATQLVPDAQ